MSRITSPDGTAISPFAFGTMQFGGRADGAASAAMFHAARDAGITHFDTAHLYNDGASEQLLGALAAPVRDSLVIATKLGYAGSADPASLQAQFDQSRRRLGMDMVDILYLHQFNRSATLESQIETLAAMKQAGAVRYLGLSNFAAWQVMKAHGIARALGHDIAIIQPMYNLVKRQAEVELLEMCAAEGIDCAPYSPLGGGLLTGKYGAGGPGTGQTGRLQEDDRYNARYGAKAMHEAAHALSEIGAELGVHPATLAAAWVAHHPARPMPILSARSAAQLAPSLDAIGFAMDEALYARLSALYPAPPPATDRTEDG